jgi:hypothetical protein
MICRMWHGWTSAENADAYESYLRNELFPHVERDLAKHGYRGFHVLRLARGPEVEFLTMLWFESLENVKSFAGDNYAKPVISEKAKKLLARSADLAEHYALSGSSWPGFSR